MKSVSMPKAGRIGNEIWAHQAMSLNAKKEKNLKKEERRKEEEKKHVDLIMFSGFEPIGRFECFIPAVAILRKTIRIRGELD